MVCMNKIEQKTEDEIEEEYLNFLYMNKVMKYLEKHEVSEEQIGLIGWKPITQGNIKMLEKLIPAETKASIKLLADALFKNDVKALKIAMKNNNLNIQNVI